jgi:putative ABC transport system permease protein
MRTNLITLSKVVAESFRQATQQLVGNKLRSFLSLLGITIGIFCIIGVQASVDSLERDIRESFEKLGDDVVYVSKFFWGEDPSQNWWKYRRRPEPGPEDYEAVKKRSDLVEQAAFWFFLGAKPVKYRNSSVERAFLVGHSFEYGELFKLGFQKGRYFSQAEYARGAPKVIIGHEVAESLFGHLDPIGRQIKVWGRKFEVIGVLEQSGEDLISVMNYDEVIFVAYPMAQQLVNFNRYTSMGGGVAAKAVSREKIEEMKDEMTGILRASRRLKPREENDFSLNTLSILANVLDSFFRVLNTLGLVIGIFAIFVGAFSVANIMFVSVKERTNIIGIKKALGAKNYMVLLEFLIESIILCIVGGVIGILFVTAVLAIVSNFIDFNIFVGANNVINGLIWSIGIGIVAGFIPALQASRMNPVDAIRSK